ncbi:MAG: hypothetical protein ABSA93_10340 [Streptosporangiaceae bacterium]|jgi:hypothetical protein
MSIVRLTSSGPKPFLAALSVIAVCALTACATANESGSSGSTASGSAVSTVSHETPKQRAEADAAANLASFVAPPGARRLARVPSDAASLNKVTLTAGQIDDTSYWQLAGTPDTALSWVKTHLPSKFTLLSSGTVGGIVMTPYVAGTSGSAPATISYDEFALPAVAGTLPARVLLVSAVSVSAGQTVIRVDAQDAWQQARTDAQRVPSTVTEVTVAEARASGPISVGDTKAVTSPALVRKLVALVNGLPLYPTASSGAWVCPMQLMAPLRLIFRDGTAGKTVATATVNSEGCGTVSLVIGSGPAVELGNAAQFATQVRALTTLVGVNPGGPMRTVGAS